MSEKEKKYKSHKGKAVRISPDFSMKAPKATGS